MPGVADTVRLVKAKRSICVASNGLISKMQVTLAETRLLHLFEGKLFDATHVKRGKPHPDLFLFAASQMGVPPGACAVAEDSVSGVKAAVAAGMPVLAYVPRGDPCCSPHWAAVTFESMREIPGRSMH